MMDMLSFAFLARNRVKNGDQSDDSVTAALKAQIYPEWRTVQLGGTS